MPLSSGTVVCEIGAPLGAGAIDGLYRGGMLKSDAEFMQPIRQTPPGTEKVRHSRKHRRVIVFAALVASISIARLPAQSQPAQYVRTVWQTEQGLPQNSVNAIVQDHRGYLWIGTFGGLARFDGERFRVFDSADTPGFGNNRILSLYENRSGVLWIGTVDGGLIRLDDDVATTYTERDGLPSRFIRSIRGDAEGNVWINTSEGVARFSGTKLEAQRTHLGKPVREFYLKARDGGIWFRSGQDLLRFSADGSIATLRPRKPSVFLIREARDGSVWIVLRDEYRLVHYEGGVFSDVSLPPVRRELMPEDREFAVAITESADGALLLFTPAGLVRIVNGKLSPPQPLSMPADAPELPKVRGFLSDREGNLWFGTVGKGLVRLRPTPLTAYGKDEGLSDSSFYAVFQDREGRVWLGGDFLYWFDGRQFHLFPGVRDTVAIAQTRDGDLWFGGYAGLYRWRSDVLSHFKIDAPAVHTIYQDRDGTLWIGASTEDRPGGLFRFREEKVDQIPGISGVSQIIEDREGGFWVAGLEGLFHMRDGKAVSYDQKHGLPDHIQDIYQDSSGTLWLATYGRGLFRWRDGKLKAITTKDGLPNNMVLRILNDGRDNLWLSSNQNIFRLSLKEMTDFAEGRISSVLPVSYGLTEGMKSSECNGGSPGGWKTSDGRMWFPTLRGVVAIDPTAANLLPPPIVVEEASANNVSMPLTGQAFVPAGHNTFDFRFTALSFAAPEKLHFKYRLEPFDKDWVDAGTRRTAHYTNMAPGNYSFLVVAANNYGVWNDQGARVRFELRPHFYQTNSFYASEIAAFFLVLWGLYRLRVYQIHREFNAKLEGRVDERLRVARELHDTLLQSVQGLMLRLQVVHEMLPAGAAKDELEQTLELGDQAIVEGRKTVHDLRFSNTHELAQAVRTLGNELATRSKVSFRVVVQGPAGKLHETVRDELYRIAGEALRNAFTHARAEHIETEITFGDRSVRMRIRDDGQGTSAEILKAGRSGHFGLAGMQERARRIGAKLTIWSAIGAGTEIDVSIPGAIAYGKPSRGSRFAFLHRKAGGD